MRLLLLLLRFPLEVLRMRSARMEWLTDDAEQLGRDQP
jgi:hypothetical protein